MQAKGIDISKWQKGMKLADAKAAGYQFAILRAGYTSNSNGTTLNKDPQFETFYAEAKKIGMPVGAYWYSCANSNAKARREAEYMIAHCLKGKTFEFPIYIDVEETKYHTGKAVTTSVIRGFCDKLKENAYFAGVYSSRSWFEHNIDTSAIKDLTKWVANWSEEKPNIKLDNFDMWQNGADAKIKSMAVDTDIAYRDFETEIKTDGWNGFEKQVAPAKTVDEVAREVLRGKWGTGSARKIALIKAGYNYDAVQEKVNELLGKPVADPSDAKIEAIAKEVLAGKWGTGAARRNALTEAGYDYARIQEKVNELLGKSVKQIIK